MSETRPPVVGEMLKWNGPDGQLWRRGCAYPIVHIGRDWIDVGCEGGGHCDISWPPSSHWERAGLPPQEVRPAAGQRWRAPAGDDREFVLARRGGPGDEFDSDGERYRTWWDTNGEPWYEHVGGTITNCTRISPAPQPAAPMVGPTKCGSCIHPPHLGACTHRNGGTAHACGCLKDTPRPAPAAPTGTPAPKQHPCVSCGKVKDTSLRWWKTAPEPTRWCDPCYLQAEEQIANKAINRETSKPSQPPRWWQPAIESLGAVRPFGRPRGVR